MIFDVPKFTDGEILSEEALYKLAQLSLQFFRWNSIAGQEFGFFAPTQALDSWNKFSIEQKKLVINNLYVISEQGYPFILEGSENIKVSGTILYAEMNLARDSQFYKKPGYNIDFKWDLSKQDINKQENPVILLGKIEDDQETFRLMPPVNTLNSTSDLSNKVSKFKEVICGYRDALNKYTDTHHIRGEEFIYGVNRLCNIPLNTRIAKFVDDICSTLQYADSFYHRHKLKQEALDSIKSCLEDIYNMNLERYSNLIVSNLLDEVLPLFQQNSNLWTSLYTRKIYYSDSQYYNNNLKIYRYDLDENQEEFVIEFMGRSSDIDFAFSQDKKLPKERKSLKRNKIEGTDKNRRYSVSKPRHNRYLFIVAPETMNFQVEIST